jgi:hypothetical protein
MTPNPITSLDAGKALVVHAEPHGPGTSEFLPPPGAKE